MSKRVWLLCIGILCLVVSRPGVSARSSPEPRARIASPAFAKATARLAEAERRRLRAPERARAGVGPREQLMKAVGIFTDSSDVGTPSTIGAGSASYDAASQMYTISGGGENMWAAADHFQYVWKKMSGDVTLEAAVDFVGTPNSSAAKGPSMCRRGRPIASTWRS